MPPALFNYNNTSNSITYSQQPRNDIIHTPVLFNYNITSNSITSPQQPRNDIIHTLLVGGHLIWDVQVKLSVMAL